MEQLFDFDAIRPYEDNEIQAVFDRLIDEPVFIEFIQFLYPDRKAEAFVEDLSKLKSLRDFQQCVIVPYLQSIVDNSTNGITSSGWENIEKGKSYFFISNHRDIILDSAFLNYLMFENGFDTTEIAIGDNLLVYPWINDLVRLNKSFIVNRNVTIRQMLEVSKRLSAYIKFAQQEKGNSIWMAQREGRSKDANDRTHDAVLKMLNMSGEGNFIRNMEELNIVPVSISYEFDPCDFLKAREYLLKCRDGNYKKEQKDDLWSMSTGLKGFKGKVHFHICEPINPQLKPLEAIENRNSQISSLAQVIDYNIHKNYNLFLGNYIAFDCFTNSNRFKEKYTKKEKETFLSYINGQVDKVFEKEADSDKLQLSILEMYANPLINFYAAKGKPVI